MENKEQVFEVLKSIKEAIDNEEISYGEIHYLQSHKQEVLDYGDMVLAQWADITEQQWNMGKLFDEVEIVKDLLDLDKYCEQCDTIEIGMEEYTISQVKHFEDEYDFNEYDSLEAFIKNIVHSADINFLDEAGICILPKNYNEYDEDRFIPFVDLATKYKSNEYGGVRVKSNKTKVELA